MKIVNDTQWKTSHLRAIASRIASAELEPEERRKLVVTFTHELATDCCSGFASYTTYRCTVRMPRTAPHAEENRTWIYDLAAVTAHEIAHCHGQKGERWMRSSVRYGHAGLGRRSYGGEERRLKTRKFYAWVFSMPLDRKDAPKKKEGKTPLDIAEAKFAKAQATLKKWQTKKKRATTAVTKYRKQIRYHKDRITKLRGTTLAANSGD